MKPIMFAGILMIVLGVFIIAYKGITQTETHKTIPLPPILGSLAIAGGIGLVVIGSKK